MQPGQHARMQQLLLISKVLDGRDNGSPFTLVVDSLEQSAKPLLRQYISRAKTSSTSTIFVSYETLRPPPGISHFIPAHNLKPQELQSKIRATTTSLSSTTTPTSPRRTLLILDTHHPLLTDPTLTNPSAYLSSLITPTTHLLAVYHSSQPLNSAQISPYAPSPLTLLTYLATTILTLHSLHHILAAKAARDRSRAAPFHGLEEAEEGTVQGLGANDARGVVVEAEVRRRSGRSIALWFVLDGSTGPGTKGQTQKKKKKKGGQGPFAGIALLDEHALYAARQDVGSAAGMEREKVADESEHGEVSFDLGLTEKQRRDREAIVLPYHDAQNEMGVGEGGRILYDMGSEDDFDDEEDEI